MLKLELGIWMQSAGLFHPENGDEMNPGPSQETSGGNRHKLAIPSDYTVNKAIF